MKFKKILFLIFAMGFIQIKPAEQKVEPSKWAKILESQEFKNGKDIVLDFLKKASEYLENHCVFNNSLPKDEQPDLKDLALVEKIKTVDARQNLFFVEDKWLTTREIIMAEKEPDWDTLTFKSIADTNHIFDLVKSDAKIIDVELETQKIVKEIMANVRAKTTIFSEIIGWFKQRSEIALLYGLMIVPITYMIYREYQNYKEYKKLKEIRENNEEI